MILTLNSGSAHGSPMTGGTGPADAATDTLVRNLAIELGPRGVRAVGLWAAGVPETFSEEKLKAVEPERGHRGDPGAPRGTAHDPPRPRSRRDRRHRRLLASGHAAGITGTFVDVNGGMFPG